MTDWNFDVDPRFDVSVTRRGPVFYSAQITDTATGRRVPISGGGDLLTGRSSVERAVRWATRRYLAELPAGWTAPAGSTAPVASGSSGGGIAGVRVTGATSRQLLRRGWILRGVACLFALLIFFESVLPGGAHVAGRIGVAGLIVFTLLGFAATAAGSHKGRVEERYGYTTRRSRLKTDPSLSYQP